ncbi:DUF3017 domain-containing protein [Streptomyces sp. MUM 178J]|uniref:DUF3017 domain-containing protein n=1 Tax=Streptomyces sp. MUM 178J TaxID=2791991 RepID=UPI001F04EBFC|nr:DUF3017 domain-containing protein [Streptomyces sp. MUM 178J]WRQ81817.1 DUF3017 domain-containing protein [Streptomyces sp. MUM 178J]
MGVSANSGRADDEPEPSGDPSATSAGSPASAGPADDSPGGDGRAGSATPPGGGSAEEPSPAGPAAAAGTVTSVPPHDRAGEAESQGGPTGRPAAETSSARPAADSAGPEAEVSSSAAAMGHASERPMKKGSRRFPAVTTDTARPEGGGRAAPGDAPAPARQWPLLTVLLLVGVGLVVVGVDAFADSFRIGTILIGGALIGGAVMRRVVPSVGMLAVRSRFTDMVTYGLLGTLIVLLALVTQPKPWLDVPFLEDAVHFTVR